MRVVVASNPALGHLLPMLPLALALRDAGHEVIVLGGASLARPAATVGLPHVVAGPPDLPSVFVSLPELAGLTGARHAVAVWSRVFAGVIATAMAAALIDLSGSWRADLVIHDDSEQGTWIAAERLGIPHVSLQATAWRGAMVRVSDEPLNRLRAQHGLASDPGLSRWHRYGYLATRPTALRDPGDPMPASTRPMRPVAMDDVLDGGAGPDVPGERSDRPRVAVTLGTIGPGRLQALGTILRAFSDLDADVFATTGTDLDPAALGALPERVRVERYVPLSRLAAASDLVVCHGGSGSMLAALAAGVPLLLMPAAADQLENGERCAAAGVARVLSPDQRDPGAIRDAATDLLHDPRWRLAAARVRDEISAMPAPSTVVPWLESLGAAGA